MAEHDSSYADFEFQHMDFQNSFRGQGDSANVAVEHTLDVLDSRGGLENDEVAELVSLRGYVVAGFEEGGSLNTDPGRANYRGAIGADLAPEEVPGEETVTADARLVDESDGGDFDAGNFVSRSSDDPGVFAHFEGNISPGFSNLTDGTGGGAGYDAVRPVSVNMRELYGRGPVLDAADNVNAFFRLVNERNSENVEISGRFTAAWDVATVEGERKDFALP